MILEVVVPDTELVEQVNDFFIKNAPQSTREVADRVIDSIDTDLGKIHSSLPINLTANPFELLASKDLGSIMADVLATPKSGKPLPIIQTSLLLTPPIGSPRRGRPPEKARTQIEINARVQKTFSLSPDMGQGRKTLSLGRPKKSTLTPLKGKKKKGNPLLTRLGAINKNLQSCFGNSTKALVIEKRGALASPRGQ